MRKTVKFLIFIVYHEIGHLKVEVEDISNMQDILQVVVHEIFEMTIP